MCCKVTALGAGSVVISAVTARATSWYHAAVISIVHILTSFIALIVSGEQLRLPTLLYCTIFANIRQAY